MSGSDLGCPCKALARLHLHCAHHWQLLPCQDTVSHTLDFFVLLVVEQCHQSLLRPFFLIGQVPSSINTQWGEVSILALYPALPPMCNLPSAIKAHSCVGTGTMCISDGYQGNICILYILTYVWCDLAAAHLCNTFVCHMAVKAFCILFFVAAEHAERIRVGADSKGHTGG